MYIINHVYRHIIVRLMTIHIRVYPQRVLHIIGLYCARVTNKTVQIPAFLNEIPVMLIIGIFSCIFFFLIINVDDSCKCRPSLLF